MTPIAFTPYEADDRGACLAMFDANCPDFFAPNERADYALFLEAMAAGGYHVGRVEGRALCAFGVTAQADGSAGLNWIRTAPEARGAGHGRAMMAAAETMALDLGARLVHIAASQHSAPFFARFGAVEISRTEDGWGPAMHRIDMEWPIGSASE